VKSCTRFYGIFAPNFKHRKCIVPQRPRSTVDRDKPVATMTWVQRLKRVFAIDIEYGPIICGRRLVLTC
jgi:hypothetical protein